MNYQFRVNLKDDGSEGIHIIANDKDVSCNHDFALCSFGGEWESGEKEGQSRWLDSDNKGIEVLILRLALNHQLSTFLNVIGFSYFEKDAIVGIDI